MSLLRHLEAVARGQYGAGAAGMPKPGGESAGADLWIEPQSPPVPAEMAQDSPRGPDPKTEPARPLFEETLGTSTATPPSGSPPPPYGEKRERASGKPQERSSAPPLVDRDKVDPVEEPIPPSPDAAAHFESLPAARVDLTGPLATYGRIASALAPNEQAPVSNAPERPPPVAERPEPIPPPERAIFAEMPFAPSPRRAADTFDPRPEPPDTHLSIGAIDITIAPPPTPETRPATPKAPVRDRHGHAVSVAARMRRAGSRRV